MNVLIGLYLMIPRGTKTISSGKGKAAKTSARRKELPPTSFSERVEPCGASAQCSSSTIPHRITHEFSYRSSQCGYGGHLKEPQTRGARCGGDYGKQARDWGEWDHVAYDAYQK